MKARRSASPSHTTPRSANRFGDQLEEIGAGALLELVADVHDRHVELENAVEACGAAVDDGFGRGRADGGGELAPLRIRVTERGQHAIEVGITPISFGDRAHGEGTGIDDFARLVAPRGDEAGAAGHATV